MPGLSQTIERCSGSRRHPARRREKIRRAEEVHHIVELKEHPELGLEEDNLISLCVPCHNLRHGRAPRRFKRKKKLVSKELW